MNVTAFIAGVLMHAWSREARREVGRGNADAARAAARQAIAFARCAGLLPARRRRQSAET